jgi:hypothetical protein
MAAESPLTTLDLLSEEGFVTVIDTGRCERNLRRDIRAPNRR